MKKTFQRFIVIALVGILAGLGLFSNPVRAEEQESTRASTGGTSISITPVSKIFQLSGGSVYDEILSVKNNGSESVNFEVYAAPYSYIYSEETDSYALGFSRENNYTQIVRWISIMDTNGHFTSRPTFTAGPGETVEVTYRVTTPDSIPDGGQYAVLFAHTISSSTGGGIKTEASPGMVIYGRSDGETIISSEISDLNIAQTIEREDTVEENGKKVRKNVTFNHINASSKVKNDGNVDFNARGVLKVTGIFGHVYYETPENKARVSIIPEAELAVSDEWEGTPIFGIYNVTWTVTAGDKTETTEMTIFLMSPSVLIIGIILLTAFIICIIIIIRKRKERRSRLTV